MLRRTSQFRVAIYFGQTKAHQSASCYATPVGKLTKTEWYLTNCPSIFLFYTINVGEH